MFSKVEFIKSAHQIEDLPEHQFPEIAFSGRSNVGKSSLINMVLGRKKLARISKTPGRTRSINFFNIEDRFCLVDLPGYGFARVPEQEKERWAYLIAISIKGAISGRLFRLSMPGIIPPMRIR